MSRKIEDLVTPSLDEVPEINYEMLKKSLDDLYRAREEAIKILGLLEIPMVDNGIYVASTDLVKILMDDEKLSVIVKKLNNKAFW